MGVFELYRDASGKFRFRILDDLGGIIAVSEAHEDKTSAMAAIGTARDCAAGARILDLCGPLPEDLAASEGGHFLG
jgi:uncharacterized protein YegP (UPF0339 family)